MAKIEGLPEGVELVRIGVCGPEEFEVTNDPTNENPPIISKGPRQGSNTQVIVRPAPGFKFSFDIRGYHFQIEKLLAQPREIAASFRFKVETEQDTQIVEKALESLRKLPGFVEPA